MPQFDTEKRAGEKGRFRLNRAERLDARLCNNGFTAEQGSASGGTVSLSCPHNDTLLPCPSDAARSELANTGAVFGLMPGLTASDYFHTVWLDTVRLGLRGILTDPGIIASFEEWAEVAAAAPLVSSEPVLVTLLGDEWEIKPRGSKWYRVLLLDGRGNAIEFSKRNPDGRHPEVMIRIGKEWCKELGVNGISAYVEELRGYLSLALEECYISQLEICVDVPFSFGVSDVIGGRWRGASTRSSGKQNRFSTLSAPVNKSCLYTDTDGGLVAWSNTERAGTTAGQCLIYNKAADVARTGDAFYQSLAASLDIDLEENEWWRVEGRFGRETLLERGLGLWEDVNDVTILALWRWFTSQYIVFVDEPGQGRADRAGILEKWAVIQDVCAGVEPLGRQETMTAQIGTLLPQAAGCVAREIVSNGCKNDDGWTEAVLNDVVEAAYSRLEDAVPFLADEVMNRIELLAQGFRVDPTEMLRALRVEVKKRVAKRVDAPRGVVPVFATEKGLRGGMVPMLEEAVKLTVRRVQRKLPVHLQGVAAEVGAQAFDAVLNRLWR